MEYLFLVPLGFIGLWRWSIWGAKKTVALFYRPVKSNFTARVSVITPVYNENPTIFLRALNSWKRNKPDEIIAVIDYSDKRNIAVFRKFKKTCKGARLIITKKPGKRPALADGIRIAKGDIVALVDCDTIWALDALKHALMPFIDKKVGGVAPKQSLYKPSTFAQKLFSIRLEQRYWDDSPFLSFSIQRLQCVSGRTALYRRKLLMPLLKPFLNEYFWGKHVISGEDKRFTYLMEAKGYKALYQSTSQVYTTGTETIDTYLKQQTRWMRNSWRSDLRALKEGWVFKYPLFAVYLIDRAVQPFTLVLSPLFFISALLLGFWKAALVILAWWHISRVIKMYPHLRKYPKDIVLLTPYIFFSFVSAYYKLFALLSLNEQGWITRWDKSRLQRFSFIHRSLPHVAVACLLFAFGLHIYAVTKHDYYAPLIRQQQLVAQAFTTNTQLAQANNDVKILGASTGTKNLKTQRYVVKDYDSLYGIAWQFGISTDSLIFANVGRLSYYEEVIPGQILTIPYTDFIPDYNYTFMDDSTDLPYLYSLNTKPNGPYDIHGRNQRITLATLQTVLGKDVIEEVAPKIWLLKKTIELQPGTMLVLDKNEVTWLRLVSTDKHIASIRAFSAVVEINGVKITSWDPSTKTYDTNYENGRSYIFVKDASRMDIYNSELAYLGYPRPLEGPYSTYGVSWRMSRGKLASTILSGEVKNTKFHHNYFGAYTFGATGMVWSKNKFYENIRYGLDPHDDSNGFLVENNEFYNNGSHGLIFSKRCMYNVVRNNISYNNRLHGIMLHEQSNFNTIVHNTLYGNTDGISLHSSYQNTIKNNTIYENAYGVLAYKVASQNTITGNVIKNNTKHGVYFYDNSSRNIIRNNSISDNTNALYIKTDNNIIANNVIEHNDTGVYLLSKARNNALTKNTVRDNNVFGVYSKVPVTIKNSMNENEFTDNNNDTYIRE